MPRAAPTGDWMPCGDTRPVGLDPSIGAIEIKITASAKDEDEGSVRAELESADAEAEQREIYFFGTGCWIIVPILVGIALAT